MNNVAALKVFFSSPLALLVLMYVASIGNGLKQLKVVSQTGNPMTLAKYLSHWPDTVAVVIGNLMGFVGLIYTDTLNIITALSIGYCVNSVADMLPGKRSLELKATPDDPYKLQARGMGLPPNDG